MRKNSLLALVPFALALTGALLLPAPARADRYYRDCDDYAYRRYERCDRYDRYDRGRYYARYDRDYDRRCDDDYYDRRYRSRRPSVEVYVNLGLIFGSGHRHYR